ncbi:hypothetical protein C8R44DRAFT_809515 [Mycena epipterygia]|nr:hypothetical protein C8R44DRAFT_809515 [Mycena epipterygia]
MPHLPLIVHVAYVPLPHIFHIVHGPSALPPPTFSHLPRRIRAAPHRVATRPASLPAPCPVWCGIPLLHLLVSL